MDPLISVIIPVYKVEPYLRECVDSVLAQTYQNLEIILVDDGSPDNCPAICDEYAEKDARVKVIHKENGGVSDARNTGLQKASGEYIAFVDSDDRIDENLYESVMKHIPFNVAIFGCTYEHKQPESVSAVLPCRTPVELLWSTDIELVQKIVFNSLLGYASNKVYRKSVIGETRFQNVAIREDLIFNLFVCSKIEKIKLIDSAGYHYLQRSDSISHNRYEGKVPDISGVLNQMMTIHPQLPKKIDRSLANRLIKHCICDSTCQFIFCNTALTEAEAAKAIGTIFMNKPLVSFLDVRLTDERLLLFLTLCMKLHAPNLFYRTMRSKWHA